MAGFASCVERCKAYFLDNPNISKPSSCLCSWSLAACTAQGNISSAVLLMLQCVCLYVTGQLELGVGTLGAQQGSTLCRGIHIETMDSRGTFLGHGTCICCVCLLHCTCTVTSHHSILWYLLLKPTVLSHVCLNCHEHASSFFTAQSGKDNDMQLTMSTACNMKFCQGSRCILFGLLTVCWPWICWFHAHA